MAYLHRVKAAPRKIYNHLMILLSLQTGAIQTLPNPGETDPHRTWTTGIYKSPISGPIWLWRDGLTGDGQADLVNHGGEDKAVNVYPSEHFPHWVRDLGVSEIPFGGFGENFTTQGLTEKDVSIGDVFELGSAVVQISQPRQPCWKLAKRWNVKDLPLRVEQTGMTGWYFRVLKEGFVEAGQKLKRTGRSSPEWTIDLANQIMHHRETDLEAAAALAACPDLSASWKNALLKRLGR